MNLSTKKSLASRALKVGKDRVVFLNSRIKDIKEAITKQDIRDLQKDGAIKVNEVKGRKKVIRKSKSKSPGNVRKKVNVRKQTYVIMTRKLRRYVAEAKKQGKVSHEEYKDIRKKIRNRAFKSKANLRDYIGGLNK